jgi:hypothetical protein
MRRWDNREVHFWWESPWTCAILLCVLCWVVLFI